MTGEHDEPSPKHAVLAALFDGMLAGCGLLLLFPVFCLIALAIKLSDGGPIFFRQERVGKDFRPFLLWKFRSMRNSPSSALVTASNDPRITSVGRFLRRFKLDELPQLFNVLQGEMRLVGARPEVPKYVELNREAYRVILRYPPGITDPASLAFSDEEKLLPERDSESFYISRILPQKLRLSRKYGERRTFGSDFYILFLTLLTVLRLRQKPRHETLDDF